MDKLKIDVEDLEDLIGQIEASFDIRFKEEEIENNFTLEEIIDKILLMIDLKDGQHCSTQITFHQLRQQFRKKLGLERDNISPNTSLESLFPFNGRRRKWKNTFYDFIYAAPRLEPPIAIFMSLSLIAFFSFFFLFGAYWDTALIVFLMSSSTLYALNKLGNKLPATTVGELVNKIVRLNYKKTRREYGTFNKKEVKQIIFDMFTDWLSDREKRNFNYKTKIGYIG